MPLCAGHRNWERSGIIQTSIALLLCVYAFTASAQRVDTDSGSTSNLPKPTSNLQLEYDAAREKWEQSVGNSTERLAIEINAIVRLSGPNLVPFTRAKQDIFKQTIESVLQPSIGSFELRTYKEAWPDPAAPTDVGDAPGAPYLDISGRIWNIQTSSAASNDSSAAAPSESAEWDPGWVSEFAVFFSWAAELEKRGLSVKTRFLMVNFGVGTLSDPIIPLGLLVPLQVVVAVQLPAPETAAALSSNGNNARRLLVEDSSSTTTTASWGQLNATEVSSLKEALYTELRGWAATNVEVVSYSSTTIATDAGAWNEQTAAQLESLQPTSSALIEFDITVFACNATSEAIQQGISDDEVFTSSCEQREILAAINNFLSAATIQKNNDTLGFISNGTVVAMRDRPSPVKPADSSASSSSNADDSTSNGTSDETVAAWTPWYLDMLDQRGGGDNDPPLDGKYTATADGTGVNVYLVSSGVRADHQEFQYADGRPGSRILPAWGFNGSDPLQDCADGPAWYHYGTYSASVIAGKNIGVAPNATIHSVRTRQNCLLESPGLWSPGGVPSAIDAVLSTFQRPGVLVIDTWWSPTRLSTDDDEYIQDAILQRLQRAADLDIPIIMAAGSGLRTENVCDNIFTRGKSVIKTSSVTKQREKTAFTPGNATCIDIWAPGGGLGDSMIGADGTANDTYRGVVPGAGGASWIVAGIAAQHLQLRPNLTALELKEAILSSATQDGVIGGGVAPNLLAFTNLQAEKSAAGSSKGSDDMSSGTLTAAIAVPIAVLLVGIAAAFTYTKSRRGRGDCSLAVSGTAATSGSSSDYISYSGNNALQSSLLLPSRGSGLDTTDWEIMPSQIRILKHKDGTQWLLGKGQWGEVHRGLKDGIQDVAVKTLKIRDPNDDFISELLAGGAAAAVHGARGSGNSAAEENGGGVVARSTSPAGTPLSRDATKAATKEFNLVQDAFAREIAMMQWLSRDANVVQFYGAVIRGRQLMLVTELMEGGDLRGALTGDSDGNLHWNRGGKSIALDVVRGLHFLHSHGVVHRDVKSLNILLTKDGRRAKLADVGVAEISQAGSGSVASGSDSGGFVGTLSWASPEMLIGDGITSKSDIYSLGVVLWEIATQEIPLRGRMQLPRVPQDCPQELLDVITSCMSLSPDQRPTAREVYGMLLRCPPFEGFEERVELPVVDEQQQQQQTSDGGNTKGGNNTRASTRIGTTMSTVVAGTINGHHAAGSGGGAASPASPAATVAMLPRQGSQQQHSSTSLSSASMLSSSSSSWMKSLGSLTPGLRRVVMQIRERIKSQQAEEARQAAVTSAVVNSSTTTAAAAAPEKGAKLDVEYADVEDPPTVS